MGEINWTDDQRKIIVDRGNNLLVSASAGSGKTTVMTQRIVDLIVQEKVPISNFLIVTFTKASAQDMKQKIITRLLECEQTDYVINQIDDVSTSDISDLHSFYSKMVSTYFYEVDIDPGFHIIDEVEATELKNKAISRVFEQREKGDDAEFFALIDIFQRKRQDGELRQVVFNFDNFLAAQIDGDAWFNNTLESSYNDEIDQNRCAQKINQYVCGRIEKLSKEADKFAELCLSRDCEKYYNHFVDLSSKIRTAKRTNSFTQNAKLVFEMKFATLPKVPKEFADLNSIALKLNSKIKDEFDNFKQNYISNDEGELSLAIREVKSKLTSLFGLVKDYEAAYKKIKADVRGLDFNDLERLTYKILCNSEIAGAVKEKYKYIFVDEYQDINEVQEKIISLISSENNRFMVGDIKQSIYRFRLCDPEIFIEKYRQFSLAKSGSKALDLNCNFRSDKKILKFVDRVFSGVMTESFGEIDYAKTSKFEPGENNYDEKDSTTLCYIDTTKTTENELSRKSIYSVKNHSEPSEEENSDIVCEARYVAGKIRQIMLEDKKATLSDFAILVFALNKNRKVAKFIEVLNDLNIKVSADDKYDLTKKNYIAEILNFAKYLVEENNDYLLFKVLKSKLFNFSDDDLVELRLSNESLKFCDLISVAEKIKNVDLSKKLEYFYKKTQKFKLILGLLSISDLVKKIIDEFKLFELNLISDEGERRITEIDKFVLSLPEKPATDFLIESDDFSLVYENESGGDAVKLMTVHKSKGIEFKYVFLINTSGKINFSSARGKIIFNKDFGVGLDYFDDKKRTETSAIPISCMRIFEARKIAEEQQRVLYVALTRAKQKLIVVCSKDRESLQGTFPERPTQYINWFEPIILSELDGKHDENICFENFELSDFSEVSQKTERQLLLSKKPSTESLTEFEYKFSKSTIIPLKTSISKILRLSEQFEDIDDGYEIQEQNLSEMRAISSASRGTAHHKFFELIDLKNLENFDAETERVKASFDEEMWKELNLSNIKKTLNLPFFKEIKSTDIIIKEREFFANMPASLLGENADGNIILQGVVDLIIIRDGEIIIVDYKTGRESKEKLKNYTFQINSYADAVSRAFNMRVKQKFLCFVDEQKMIEI